mgnify:CR=1 FL=1
MQSAPMAPMLSGKEVVMPITDHPKYNEWAAALDRLKEAKDRYDEEMRSNGDVATAMQRLGEAQKDYNQISDEIE